MLSNNQLRALFYKQLSYQSRQFTNIFLILACPFFVVLLAFILSLVIMNAISASFTGLTTEYVFCSSTENLNPIDIPYWTFASNLKFPYKDLNSSNKDNFPGSTQDRIYFADFSFVNSISLMISPNWPCRLAQPVRLLVWLK